VGNRRYSQLLELGQSDFEQECQSGASEDDYSRLAEARLVGNPAKQKEKEIRR